MHCFAQKQKAFFCMCFYFKTYAEMLTEMQLKQ